MTAMRKIKKWADVRSVISDYEKSRGCRAGMVGLSPSAMRRILPGLAPVDYDSTPDRVYAHLAGSVVSYIDVDGYKVRLLKPDADENTVVFFTSGQQTA